MKSRRFALAVVAALVLSIVGVSMINSPAQADTKDPVVIVGGTFAGDFTASVYYAPLATRLRADGYKAYIFALPNAGLGDARNSAAALNSFVDTVRATTGSARVNLVAHSQGGMVSRYYIKYLGGVNEVTSLVNLAAVNYGTSLANAATMLGLGSCLNIIGCQQMGIGSAFLNDLNAGDDTIGSVRYTNIVTSMDEIILPYTNGYLNNDGNNVNVKVQSKCWARVVGHVSIALDGAVYSGIRQALAKQAIDLNCWAL